MGILKTGTSLDFDLIDVFITSLCVNTLVTLRDGYTCTLDDLLTLQKGV